MHTCKSEGEWTVNGSNRAIFFQRHFIRLIEFFKTLVVQETFDKAFIVKNLIERQQLWHHHWKTWDFHPEKFLWFILFGMIQVLLMHFCHFGTKV